MRQLTWVRGRSLATLLVFGLAACGDGATAPVASELSASSATEPLMSYASSSVSDSDSDGDRRASDHRASSGMRKFTIKPGRAVLKKFGGHVLYIPANATCDPATSEYGRAFWDTPCQPARQDIEVTAQWATFDGQPVIRFKPDLRFVPTSNKRRWVILSALHPTEIDPTAYYTLLWRDPATNTWYDEAATDPSVRAQVNRTGRIVVRRLKHFSDYWLWFGFGSYNVTSGMGGDIVGVWGSW